MHDASTRQRSWRLIRTAAIFVVTYAVLLYLFVRLGGLVREPATLGHAWVTAAVLRLLGAGGVAHGPVVVSEPATLTIIFECTAVFPCMLFVAAVLAFPSSVRAKLVGLAIGVPAILVVNTARLVSLFYIEYWFPDHFETVHVVVWPGVITFLTLFLWLAWIVRFTSGAGAARA